jgi:hypothetical protein
MKKDYKKPYLLVESFQLDAAIAASCSSETKNPLHYGLDSCTLEEELPGFGYFGNLCIHDVKVEGDGNDLICYHGPIPADAMFMNS